MTLSKVYLYSKDKMLVSDLRQSIKTSYTITDLNFHHKSRLEELPSLVQHSILKLLDYMSLIQYSKAFPKYIPLLLRPVYWKNISIDINTDSFKLDEIELLANHLNKYLKSLNLSINHGNSTDIEATSINVFNNCTNLFRLSLNLTLTNKIVSSMCSQLIHLRSLEITSPNLCNDCLIVISDSFKYLDSLIIQSDLIINHGLAYFLRKTKYLRSFGYILPNTSDW